MKHLLKLGLLLPCVCFKTGPGFVAEANLKFAQAALKISIFLPQPLKVLRSQVCSSPLGLFLPFFLTAIPAPLVF